MKQRDACLLSLLAAGTLSAGVAEDFPDLFPKSEPPAAENGYPALRRLEFNKEDARDLPRVEGNDTTWLQGADDEEVAAMVKRNATALAALEKIRTAKSLYSDSWKTYELNGGDLLAILPAYQNTRLLILRDSVAARDDGNVKQAVETILRCAGFGLRICEADPLLVEVVVGSSIIKTSLRHLPALLALPQITPETLQETDQQLSKMDRAHSVMRNAMLGEARWNLRLSANLTASRESRRDFIFELAIARRFSDEVFNKAPKTEKVSPEETVEDAIRRVWKTKMPEEVTAAFQAAEKVDWKAYIRDQADGCRALRKADTSSVPAFRASFHPVDTAHYVKGTALEPLFTSSLDAKVDVVYLKLCASTASAVRLGRVAAMLRQYEIKNKRLPAALTDLVPDYCSAVPLDPFDGKPVRYDANAKRVWCVGLNLKDEKGAADLMKPDGADDEALAVP